MPSATAAAEPPDEPPAIACECHGLRTGPYALIMELPPYANSCRFCFPRRTAPAFSINCQTRALSAGTRFAYKRLPAVVKMPAVSTRSFRPIGIPCRGPRQAPARISFSACRACSRATSAITVMNALTCGFNCSICSRHCSVNSTGETLPARTASLASSKFLKRSPVRITGHEPSAARSPARGL